MLLEVHDHIFFFSLQDVTRITLLLLILFSLAQALTLPVIKQRLKNTHLCQKQLNLDAILQCFKKYECLKNKMSQVHTTEKR